MNTPTATFKDLIQASKGLLRSMPAFAEHGSGLRLRPYQIAPLATILHSIYEGLGYSIVIVFPRQSGKDELMANLKAFLMCSLSPWEHSIVEVNPTYNPQTINAIMRLETRLNMNPITLARWHKGAEFIRQIGLCKTSFLSGDGQANVVGATASLLLIINEAQDILPAIYDKKFAPMCASTNATRIFCGTAWTSTTLLGREMRKAQQTQEKDGIQRLFVNNASDVSKYHKPYGLHVAGQIASLGRNHPIVRTQYFCEEIDAQAGMFNAARRALMAGDQPAHDHPLEGIPNVFLLDVAGQDEAQMSMGDDSMVHNPGRDSVSLSIADIDMSSMEILQAPTYRITHRRQWTGQNHLTVFGQIKSLAEDWKPMYIIIDATGVGEGLWAMLDKSFPGKVVPVKFSAPVKSEIGYRFIAIIETGRFRDLCPTDAVNIQYDKCVSEIQPGPNKLLRWHVPEGTRSADGDLVHDDYLLADALVAVVDKMDWNLSTDVQVHEGFEPLESKL